MKRKTSDRYLGQILHTDGNKASADATISDREGKIKGAMFEVKSIIEDFQMQAVGGMMSAWELWEKAMIPSLLSGAGTWLGATQDEYDKCDRLQDMFWRIMLEVPESCPKVALRAETRMISMKYRVWQQKLLLLQRLKNQDNRALSSKILKVQQAKEWPGLSVEAREICSELGLPDINQYQMSGADIKLAILDHHDRQLFDEISKSKKMKNHLNDNFKHIQEYFKEKSLYHCRLAFRIRCELVKDIKGNFKDKFRRKGGEDALKCGDCVTEEIQTQSHCLICPRWADIRTGVNLDKIEGLVTFFQRMISARLEEKNGS